MNVSRRTSLLQAVFLLLALSPLFGHAVSLDNMAANIRTATTHPTTYDPRDFGAKGDEAANDTAAINRAIAAASEAGGGTVVLERGRFMANGVVFKDNVTLHIRHNAKLIAMEEGYRPPEENPYDRHQDFGHSHFENALIMAIGVKNIAIEGRGEIVGEALKARNIVPAGQGDKAISLKNVKNARFSDFSIKGGGHFALIVKGSENLLVERVTMIANRDGINFIDSRNIDVYQVFVESNDDSIALKSDYSTGSKGISENIRVRRAMLKNGCCHAIRFGSESVGGWRDVLFEDIEILSADKAGIALTTLDGGVIENVTFRNVRMTQVTIPMLVTTGPRGQRAPDSPPIRVGDAPGVSLPRTPEPQPPGRVDGIRFENIEIFDVQPGGWPIVISGVAEQPVRNVLLQDVNARLSGESENPLLGRKSGHPASGLFIEHADGVRVENLALEFDRPDSRDAVVIRNSTKVTGLDAARGSKPNIVFILADDLGWNAIGPNGNTDVDTPSLDRLAREGMRFTHAYAEAQCSPARAAFISGQWPARTGMFAVAHEEPPLYAPLVPPQRLTHLPADVATLARALRDNGYRTGFSGKWHLGGSDGESREDFFDRFGFDFAGQARNKSELKDKSISDITDDLLGFIEQNRDRPFFAWFSHFAIHTPLEALPGLQRKYVERGFKATSTIWGDPSERPTAEYYAMIEHLDHSVGRILEALDRLGLAKDTLVIFTSDNGGLSRLADMAPLRSGKGSPYEGGLRVPLLARWPGRIPAGSLASEPVHLLDYYPTFLEIAGGDAGQQLDGVSMMPLLLGQVSAVEDRTLYWHMPTYTAQYGRTPSSVIRSGPWKLVHYFGDFLANQSHQPPYGEFLLGPRTELYNLQQDPSESDDIAASEPAIKEDLLNNLRAWQQETGAAMPRNNPDFRPEQWWLKEEQAR